jgi:hypothetical protein
MVAARPRAGQRPKVSTFATSERYAELERSQMLIPASTA